MKENASGCFFLNTVYNCIYTTEEREAHTAAQCATTPATLTVPFTQWYCL